ncbi:MAG: hypothetical protein VX642_00160 [Bdellovibrionota bacterium]|nr:hypothetical protein [Bdellovibrionota bacterium]
MRVFVPIVLSLVFSISSYSAQLPNRSLNCSKSFSSEYENLFSNRQKFERDIYSSKYAKIKEQNALNRAILLNLPSRFHDRLFTRNDISLYEIRDAYENAEFSLGSQYGIAKKRQSLFAEIVLENHLPEIDFSKVHFVDAIMAYKGNFPVSDYSKQKMIDIIWRVIESHREIAMQAAPSISLSYLVQKSVYRNSNFSEVTRADFIMILKHYGHVR